MGLSAYFDASGKEDLPIITVGGFLADSDVCDDIKADWDIATNGRVFHLAEFGTKDCKLGSREWDRPARESFLKRLATIVNRSGCYVISASVEVAQYHSFIQTSPHAHVNGPAFSGCAQACIALCEFLLGRGGTHKQNLEYIFEQGDRQHELAKMVNEWKEIGDSDRAGLRSLSFEPKATTLLQPADLIAGVVQKCLISAHSALPCFDNGLSRTALFNYQHHYSTDGLTAAAVGGHDHEHCWVINPQTFKVLDRISTEFFQRHPEVLEKRLAQSPFKPK